MEILDTQPMQQQKNPPLSQERLLALLFAAYSTLAACCAKIFANVISVIII
ncbi:hypothetical protein [Methanoplanus endosymbiosus]|uniref:Uncharacterized protein n=1 Tax=Methanoplanus endosymbiosus TaxID=33865 RepID=A0A9E7PNC4_9EURY|nr:hypothetical protein [Methanoplanus endosymbiosus]UUX92124.1 hypothetical protein L6E24_12295 [Methanoplanus endosymbiosus]